MSAKEVVRNLDGSLKRIVYKVNGVRTRDDGPAVIHYHNNKVTREAWYRNGYLHNDSGAAVISYDENGNIIQQEWYLDGERLSVFDFDTCEKIDKLKAYSLFSPIEIARIKCPT